MASLFPSGWAAKTAPMDLRVVQRSPTANDALACPPGHCQAAADLESPVFATDVDALMQSVRAVIAGQPRTALVGEDRALHQLVFVQRSAVLGFPDTVWIQAVAAGGGAAPIVYSRSNYGRLDFGVNRRRVRGWLAALGRTLEPAKAR